MGRFTLIILTALILTMGYFVVSTNQSKQRALKHTIDSYEAKTLEDMAVSGARIAINMLNKNLSWRTQDFTLNLEGAEVNIEVLDKTLDPSLADGEVLLRSTAVIRDRDTNSLKHAITEVTTQAKTVFSDHAWVIDDLGGAFIANGVEIYGKFHSNGDINILRSPIFHDSVTATGAINYGSGTAAMPVGYQAPIEINLDLSEFKDTSKYYRKFVGDTDFFFNGDGTVSVNGISWKYPENAVLYFTDDVTMKGVVDKTVTFYILGEVYIPDDLVYADPTDDMLTLLTEDNLLLRAKRDSTLTVNANIFTRGDEGIVFMTDKHNPWAVTHKSHFDLLGSIIQFGLTPLHTKRKDQPFGTTSASSKQFHWTVRHDPRLENQTPPGMPVEYRITSWSDS